MPVNTPYEEEEILRRIALGDEKVFHILYLRHFSKVYAMAVSYLPDAVAAQDMVQEVFARVWLHRQKLHGILNIEAWIIAISRNLLMNELRKAYPLDVAGHVAINSTQDTLNYRELEKLLAIAITMLSSRQQEIYRLSRQEGYSHKQIAERLGISVDMSREHLSKALKNIRIFLAGKYSQVSIAS